MILHYKPEFGLPIVLLGFRIVMRKMKTLKMLRLLVVEKSPEVHLQFLRKNRVNQR